MHIHWTHLLALSPTPTHTHTVVGLHRDNVRWIVARRVNVRSNKEVMYSIASHKEGILYNGYDSVIFCSNNGNVNSVHLCCMEIMGKRIARWTEHREYQSPGSSSKKGSHKIQITYGETHKLHLIYFSLYFALKFLVYSLSLSLLIWNAHTRPPVWGDDSCDSFTLLIDTFSPNYTHILHHSCTFSVKWR